MGARMRRVCIKQLLGKVLIELVEIFQIDLCFQLQQKELQVSIVFFSHFSFPNMANLHSRIHQYASGGVNTSVPICL